MRKIEPHAAIQETLARANEFSPSSCNVVGVHADTAIAGRDGVLAASAILSNRSPSNARERLRTKLPLLLELLVVDECRHVASLVSPIMNVNPI
jgi:hypothetical protein